MVKLKFTTTEEFEALFKKHNKKVIDGIAQGIENAITERKKSADLFEITFEEAEIAFDICLPQSQWVQALENCLEFYHKVNEADAAIDTWKLLEIAKTC